MDYLLAESERYYQQLQQLNAVAGWKGRPFDQFPLRAFLELGLGCLRFPQGRRRALEYGTGTGPGACFLAAHGFEVVGIDVSPTAIALAQQFASERPGRVRFEVQDIRTWPSEPVFDLVVDNCCLHFHLTDEARRDVLAAVRSALAPTGYYLLGTATYVSGRNYATEHRLRDPRTGIVYRLAQEGEAHVKEGITREGLRYVPHRRHLSAADLYREVTENGFHVLQQQGGHIIATLRPDHPPLEGVPTSVLHWFRKWLTSGGADH